MGLTLNIIRAKFKNQTISKHWFIANQEINELHFSECNIETVEGDAFENGAFRLLVYLQISNNDGIITFYPNSLKGLRHIVSYNYRSSSLSSANVGHLNDISRSLRAFCLLNCSGEIGFQNIFGEYQFANLEQILIKGSSAQQFRTLAPSNFTNLLALEALAIMHSSLEIILDGTFDGIAKTLQRIILSHNRLTTIAPGIVQAYFEHSHLFFNSFSLIHDNQLDCNCENRFVRGVYELIYRPLKPEVCVTCERPPSASADQTYCLNAQQIRSEKVCWSHDWRNLFSYIRFDIKRDDDGILIRTNATGSVKVVLMRSGMQFERNCPDARSLRRDVKCYIFNGNVQKLPQSKLIESNLIQISILYFIHGWPLCFMTVQSAHDSIMHPNWVLIALAITVGYVSAMFLGLLIMFVLCKVSHCSNAGDVEDYCSDDSDHYIDFQDANNEYIYI